MLMSSDSANFCCRHANASLIYLEVQTSPVLIGSCQIGKKGGWMGPHVGSMARKCNRKAYAFVYLWFFLLNVYHCIFKHKVKSMTRLLNVFTAGSSSLPVYSYGYAYKKCIV